MLKWILIIIAVEVIALLLQILRPDIVGWVGEKIVAVLLRRLPREKYRVLNDVLIQTERGTSQIDHVVISLYGIFVVELKNYKGWIMGSEYSEKWTQNIYGHKSQFYNPLRQNYGHVKALSSVLCLKEDLFIPVVVFSGNTTIKVETQKPVIKAGRLVRFIRSYKEEIMDSDEINRITEALNTANITGIEARKEHVDEIYQKAAIREQQIEEGICPLCGGKLVNRKGKYGPFMGCINYPKCRYTKKID